MECKSAPDAKCPLQRGVLHEIAVRPGISTDNADRQRARTYIAGPLPSLSWRQTHDSEARILRITDAADVEPIGATGMTSLIAFQEEVEISPG